MRTAAGVAVLRPPQCECNSQDARCHKYNLCHNANRFDGGSNAGC